MLALSEGFNNAIEHAYELAGGVLGIQASVGGDVLRLEVSDNGRWRVTEANEERGRGLLLMQSLMDSVEVDTSAAGTRVTMERRYEQASGRAAVPAS